MGKSNYNFKKLHPFKWFILQNYPFLEDSIDVLTNYQLFCKLGEMINNQVAPINEMGEQVESLTNAFNDLYDWFENLDVQEEINNKLDEMAESGQLEEIISIYLNSIAMFCFDNVADMKQSQNLIEGSYARTLGYYEKNDGGSAIYKIRTLTNEDTVDESFIVAIGENNLIAELIVEKGIVNVKTLGIKENDNEINNSAILNNAIQSEKYTNFFIPKGKYYFNSAITLLPRVNIRGDFDYDYFLNYSDYGIYFENSDGFVESSFNIIDGLSLYGSKSYIGIKRKTSSNGSKINNCCIFNFNIGIEGNKKSFEIINTIVADCNTGIKDLTDGVIENCIVKTCTNNGIELTDCGDTRIINNRIEWNGGHGIKILRGWHMSVIGNIIDRSSLNGLFFQQCPNSIIDSNLFRRNYASANQALDSAFSHVNLQYTTHLNFTNNMTDANHIVDGDDTSNIEPAHSVYMLGSSYVNMIGNDLTGCRERNIIYSGYPKRIMISDSTLTMDSNYQEISAGNSHSFELPLAYIPGTGLIPSIIKLTFSYRATSNAFWKIIEKDLAFINDNGNILVESFSDNTNSVSISTNGIANNKLKINVVNNSSANVRFCVMHGLTNPPFTGTYEENNYTV